jgi:plasmid stabilization system protein ParE
MNYNVIFAPEASDDLESLLVYLIDEAGPETARSYVVRLWITASALDVSQARRSA